MMQPIERFRQLPSDRLAELVRAASYGTVLVLGALGAIGAFRIERGYTVELMASVGVASWVAHVFAELLSEHVRVEHPLHREEVRRVMTGASPIVVAPVLPALALLTGQFDLVADKTAALIALFVALGQLLAIGAVVARVAPARRASVWLFAAATVGIGLLVGAVIVGLGH